jgi:hypothetical protein
MQRFTPDVYPLPLRNPHRLRVIRARGTASSYSSFNLGLIAA